MSDKPKLLSLLDWLSLLLLAAATYMALVFAPMEAVMGNVQRVFYFHVAVGWVGMMGFLLAVAAGVLFLATGNSRWDIFGVAGVEVGLVFSLLNIVTGSIWARPVWNTWWTWDPRLVTATIMVLVYVAYLLLRQGIEDPERRARFGAIYALLGFISVPLSFLSIRIWRTIHPVVVGNSDPGAQGTFDMTSDMRITFFFSLITFTVIAVDLLWRRVRLGQLAAEVEQLRLTQDI